MTTPRQASPPAPSGLHNKPATYRARVTLVRTTIESDRHERLMARIAHRDRQRRQREQEARR